MHWPKHSIRSVTRRGENIDIHSTNETALCKNPLNYQRTKKHIQVKLLKPTKMHLPYYTVKCSLQLFYNHSELMCCSFRPVALRFLVLLFMLSVRIINQLNDVYHNIIRSFLHYIFKILNL